MKKNLIILFISSIYCISNAARPLYFSAKGVRRLYRDKAPIRTIKEIHKDKRNDPYLFFRYLELYQDSDLSVERMKIMKDYYKTESEEQYRLLSLMLLFNPYDPRNYSHQKLIDRFLINHYHELDVLNLFLYRYSTIDMKPPPSFAVLYKHLKQKIPEFLPSDFRSMTFLDLMMSQEINMKNKKERLKLSLDLWTEQMTNQSSLYFLHRHFIKKVMSFYSFYLSKVHHPEYFNDFHKKREKLFEKYGYSKESLITKMANSFQFDSRLRDFPEFLPYQPKEKNSKAPYYLQGL
ncbi:MAG: hypothetical protein KC646_13190 [Candidatus Cloacimonetes bacterium]|nr:hypothetical protein [Candidatus Cloacimonadota bacterium]